MDCQKALLLEGMEGSMISMIYFVLAVAAFTIFFFIQEREKKA